MSVHNGGNYSVHGTRYGILWPWYDQFEAQVWLSTDISLVDLVLASKNNDLCHVKTRPICSDPAAGYKNWLVTFNQHNEFLPMGQCNGRGTPLLIGRHIHFPQWQHYGLLSSRDEHVCLYHPITRGDWWADKRLLSISPVNRYSTISNRCRLQYHTALAPRADNSPMPEWLP